jgi:hypothetical protein
MPIIVNPNPLFQTRAECVRRCQRDAALSETTVYAVHCPGFPEAPWRIQGVAPLVGQYWSVDPDGLTIHRG